MTRIVTYTLAAALVVASAGRTTSAFGFNVEGLQTGMTVDEVAAKLRPRGLTIDRITGDPIRLSVYGIVKSDQSLGPLVATAFCDGRLVEVLREINLDIDYTSTLRNILEQHGNPSRVGIEDEPHFDPAGGNTVISKVEMFWYFGDDRITISFIPDGRAVAARYRSGIWYHTQTERCPFPDW